MMCPENKKRIEYLKKLDSKRKGKTLFETNSYVQGIKEGAANERKAFQLWLLDFESSFIPNDVLNRKIKELEDAA